MKGNDNKTVYFIYAQNGVKNNIKKLNLINDAEKIPKEIFGNTIRILYAIKIPKIKNEKKISLSLEDNQGDTYISNIPLNLLEQLEEEEGIKFNNIILFKLRFTSLNYDQIDKLDQIILPYDQQFSILENRFKNDDDIMISLYLNAISQIFLKSKQKYDFILKFFLKTYEKSKRLPKFEIVMKYFFQNIKNILRNCNSVQLTIPKEQLNIFGNIKNIEKIEKIRTDLMEVVGAQSSEENVDIFLSYYYIHFEHKLFIKFINNKKYKNKINITLNSNRNLFNNFTTEIITPFLMNEAESIDELITLMMLYPNIVECFHILILDNLLIAHKINNLIRIKKKKSINILTIQKPKKSDNMNLLKEYFTRSLDLFRDENIYPFKIQENFFHEYFKLFEDNDEEFDNIIKIIEMSKLYSKTIEKINTEQLFNSFYQKGKYLLKNKKLKNSEFIKFLKNAPGISNNNKEILDYFPIGIEFNDEKYGNDKEYLNRMLNEDKYELRQYLGHSYAGIFEKNLKNWLCQKIY